MFGKKSVSEVVSEIAAADKRGAELYRESGDEATTQRYEAQCAATRHDALVKKAAADVRSTLGYSVDGAARYTTSLLQDVSLDSGELLDDILYLK